MQQRWELLQSHPIKLHYVCRLWRHFVGRENCTLVFAFLLWLSAVITRQVSACNCLVDWSWSPHDRSFCLWPQITVARYDAIDHCGYVLDAIVHLLRHERSAVVASWRQLNGCVIIRYCSRLELKHLHFMSLTNVVVMTSCSRSEFEHQRFMSITIVVACIRNVLQCNAI